MNKLSKDRKVSPQVLQKEKDIQESKKVTLDSLFIHEGKIKLQLKQLDEEKSKIIRDFNNKEFMLRKELSRTKRLINYKREALQK